MFDQTFVEVKMEMLKTHKFRPGEISLFCHVISERIEVGRIISLDLIKCSHRFGYPLF